MRKLFSQFVILLVAAFMFEVQGETRTQKGDRAQTNPPTQLLDQMWGERSFPFYFPKENDDNKSRSFDLQTQA